MFDRYFLGSLPNLRRCDYLDVGPGQGKGSTIVKKWSGPWVAPYEINGRKYMGFTEVSLEIFVHPGKKVLTNG